MFSAVTAVESMIASRDAAETAVWFLSATIPIPAFFPILGKVR